MTALLASTVLENSSHPGQTLATGAQVLAESPEHLPNFPAKSAWPLQSIVACWTGEANLHIAIKQTSLQYEYHRIVIFCNVSQIQLPV